MKLTQLYLLTTACILSATPYLGAVELVDDDQQSKLFPCPIASDIAPCVCSHESQGLLLNCNSITSDQQLSAVFRAHFPVTDFYKLDLDDAQITKLGSDLNTLTFTEIYVRYTPLQRVEYGFLTASTDTLVTLMLQYGDLSVFPFEELSLMSKLQRFDVWSNSIDSAFPPLSSDSLLYVFAGANNIPAVNPGTFDEVPGLVYIHFQFNSIKELLPNTFIITPSVYEIRLNGNSIAKIYPGAFVLPGSSNLQYLNLSSNAITELTAGTIIIPTSLRYLYLDSNSIGVVYPGAFVISSGTSTTSLSVYLNDNRLETLEQAAFEELFYRASYVKLNSNPLLCHCDMAWLITNPLHMSKLDSSTSCVDGRYVSSLDPSPYQLYC